MMAGHHCVKNSTLFIGQKYHAATVVRVVGAVHSGGLLYVLARTLSMT